MVALPKVNNLIILKSWSNAPPNRIEARGCCTVEDENVTADFLYACLMGEFSYDEVSWIRSLIGSTFL
jgi:hypothetical protein